MAARPTGWAYEHVVTGDPNTKSVLVALADNADHNGFCFPSQDLLAKKTELSVATVKRKLKLLEKFGVIAVIRKQIDAQKRRNYYRLALNKTFDLTKAKDYMRELPDSGFTGVTVTPVNSDTLSIPDNPGPVDDENLTGSTVTPVNLTGVTLTPVTGSQGSPGDLCESFTGVTVTPVWGHQVTYELPDNLTTTPPPLSRGVNSEVTPGQELVTLDFDWHPNDYAFERLDFLYGIPRDFAEQSLIKFVEYHNGAQRRQAQFEKLFITWVHTDRERGKELQQGPQREGIQGKFDKLTDRGWAG